MTDSDERKARLKELAQRLASVGTVPYDAALGARRLAEAEGRCHRAYLSAAAAHDRAAQAHDRAAGYDSGDRLEHITEAVRHRDARDADLRAAEG